MTKTRIVIRGNVKTCSYCKAFMGTGGLMDGADYAKLFPGATVDIIEANANPEAFKANKERLSGNWPIVAVFDASGAKKGQFTARKTSVKPWTQARFAEMVLALCPDCCVAGGCGEPEQSPAASACVCKSCGCKVSFCPTCGKELK